MPTYSPKSNSKVKPYDMWRQQLVTKTDNDALSAARRFSLAKDFSDVSHLTKVGKGAGARNEYVSAQNACHGNEEMS
jgi:hypothetical protein